MAYQKEIVIVGVGYVGLPLAMSFSKEFKVTAYDRNPTRIEELKPALTVPTNTPPSL
jgi:UDP-N-acetyl-D-galactosamine dehydrogenase